MVQNCRVYRSAQFLNTDHRLVVAALRIRLKTARLPPASSQLDVGKLAVPEVSNEYSRKLADRFEGVGDSDDPAEMWLSFKATVLDVASGCVGTRRRTRRGFVSDGTLDIIERSRRARLDGRLDLFRSLRREAVRSLRADKESHVSGICRQVESHLWSSDSRPAYRAIRTLRSSKPAPQCVTVKADDGAVLSDASEVRARWAGYFERLYQAEPPSRELNVMDVAVPEADPPINCDPPTTAETRSAVAQLKCGKAPGVCGIHAELLRSGGEAVLLRLHAILCAVWRTKIIPTDWKRGLIVPLWKGKGDPRDCNNSRGVTLLSVPGKVLARIILSRIRDHLLAHQRPEQSGFTPKKSTTDRILALRVLIERKREFRQQLLAAYVDFRKAFDSVDRSALWTVLRLRGVPPVLVDLISELYSGTVSAVKCGSGISSFFPVNTGVRQGCVLAPSLFSACMDWIFGRVSDHTGIGASFGNVKITDLDFADDAVIFAETLDGLTSALETLSEEAEPLGLRVSWIKTKVQVFVDLLDAAVQSVPACGENVEVVERFTYLGSDIHVSGSSAAEIGRRIGRACGVMDSLDKGVWRSRYLCKRTKVRVFRSLVLPVLLYGCETWTVTGDLGRRLNSFGTISLRRILGYRWFDFMSNERVLHEAGMRSVTCIIRERQLRSFGHVARFPEADPAHQIISSRDPVGWRRPPGRPRTTWLRQVDRYCREMGLGKASAWGISRRRPQEYRRRVDAATRCLGVCSHT
jgi:hypothetical protein